MLPSIHISIDRFISLLSRVALAAAVMLYVYSPSALAEFELAIIDDQNEGRRAVADIDGDGFNDIVVHKWAKDRGKAGDGELSWYRYPDWRKSIIADGKEYFGDYIETIDFDSDGDIDVIAPQGTDGVAKLFWYENIGSKWKEHYLGEVKNGKSEAKDILIADFDNDKKFDIAIRTDSAAAIFFQNDVNDFFLREIAIDSHEGGVEGDVDMDGYTDLIFNGYWIKNPGKKARTSAWKKIVIDPVWFSQDTGEWRDNSVRAQFEDLNGDGRPDVIFTHSEKNNFEFAWYENIKPKKGAKGWKKHSLPKQNYAHTLLAHDYDLDGDVDFLTAGTVWNDYNHQRKGDTRLWENDGKGKFTSRTVSDKFNYVGVLGDIDNNGDMDMVGTLAWDRPPIYVLRNDFAVSANDWSVNEIDTKRQKFGDWNKDYEWLRYFGLDSKDINGDGTKELLSGRYIYHNTGDSLKSDWKRYDLGQNIDGWAFVDVDGDEYSDAIGFAGPRLYWLEADCASAKKCQQKDQGKKWSFNEINLDKAFKQPDHFNPQGVRVTQVQLGGRSEISFEGSDGLYVLSIPTNTEAKWPIKRVTDFTGDGHAWGDMDNDGDLDLVTTASKSPNTAAWYRNPGNLSSDKNLWEKAQQIGEFPLAPDRYSAADLDGDGDLDVVVGLEVYPVGSAKTDVYMLINLGSDNKKWQQKIIFKGGESVNSLQVADMDFDADVDIVFGEMGGEKRIMLLENDGKGDFSTQHIISKGREIHGLIVEDLDMDGDKDAAAIAWDGYKSMYVFTNNAVENLPASLRKPVKKKTSKN